jgi:hypothetical protein
MSNAEAQIPAPITMPQASQLCEFCGSPLVLDPTLPECCYAQLRAIQALQLESARHVARHVQHMRSRLTALEAKFAELESPAPVLRKAKG